MKEPLNSEKLKEAKNKLKNEQFACVCGLKLKHKRELKNRAEIIPCNMLILDQILKANGCWCTNHSIQVCCICTVTCHKNCNVIYEEQNQAGKCNCRSDFHTNFNELALLFPLQDYKLKTGINVWPIQILNILFNTKNIFTNMCDLFKETLIHLERPITDIDQSFFPLLELFLNTLNRKFKTFYYDDELINMFNYNNLIKFMFKLPMDNGEILLVRFRLLFILLFIHLKKDYQDIKTLTSIDFHTVPILERFKYKKRLYTLNETNEELFKKYYPKKVLKGVLIKTIAIGDCCKLMEVGMNYLPIEENQDEFEIGLKYLCFLLKRMIFNNEELDRLIQSLFLFYGKFFDYLNKERANIYSLLGILNTTSEIYFLIAVNYNDNIVYDFIELKTKNIEGFIHSKSESKSLLFKMVLKSCDILKKHYSLLQKQDSDSQSNQERKREMKINKYKLALQAKIEATTTGVKLALPSNGGLIVDKIITVFNEALKLFALANNTYFQQLKQLTKDDLVDYYSFNQRINKNTYGNFFFNTRLNIKDSSNPIRLLKQTIEKLLYDLFTGSYTNNNLRISTNICDAINQFIDCISKRFEYLSSMKAKQKNPKRQTDYKRETSNQNFVQQKAIHEFQSLK